MNENSPLSVLIVDDEAPARVRLRDVLGDIAGELPNVVAAEAANGVQALDALARLGAAGQGVDVLLVDIRMPTMDGIELARHLAQLEHAPGIIFVTAYDNYAVHAFELSAIDYLVKPVRAPCCNRSSTCGESAGRPWRTFCKATRRRCARTGLTR